jgi:hypothetical protein
LVRSLTETLASVTGDRLREERRTLLRHRLRKKPSAAAVAMQETSVSFSPSAMHASLWSCSITTSRSRAASSRNWSSSTELTTQLYCIQRTFLQIRWTGIGWDHHDGKKKKARERSCTPIARTKPRRPAGGSAFKRNHSGMDPSESETRFLLTLFQSAVVVSSRSGRHFLPRPWPLLGVVHLNFSNR